MIQTAPASNISTNTIHKGLHGSMVEPPDKIIGAPCDSGSWSDVNPIVNRLWSSADTMLEAGASEPGWGVGGASAWG